MVAANPDLLRLNPHLGRPPALESRVLQSPHPNKTHARALALAMSEGDLQASVIELAHFHAWKVVHFRSVKVQKKDGSTFWQTPVAADGEGFPDLVLVRDDPAGGMGRILFVECKKEREKPRPSQAEWLDLLKAIKRVEVYVWKPSAWMDGTIDALLRR